MNKISRPKLVIIDFDLTITQEHVHNKLVAAINAGIVPGNDHKAQWELVKNVLPTGSAQKWHDFFLKLVANNIHIGIASFNEFRPIIELYLKEVIKLDVKVIKKIIIESWLPSNLLLFNKQVHIEKIIRHFNFAKTPLVILIDDSSENCAHARQSSYLTIEAKPADAQANQIDEALKLLGLN